MKEKAGWTCIRCRHEHDPSSRHTLTVHHIDGDKLNNDEENLAVLCQRCHLLYQGTLRNHTKEQQKLFTQ